MKLTLGVMAAFASAALAGSAAAQDTNRLQTILDRGHIIVGTGSTNPPWHFKDEAGELIGYFVLLVAAGEAHLLNLTVAAGRHRRGHGASLLREAMHAGPLPVVAAAAAQVVAVVGVVRAV